MDEIIFWTLASKIIGTISLVMAIYALSSGRVYGRSWEKYIGGWIYRKENPSIFVSYVFMYFVIAFFLFLCLIIF